MLPWCWTGTGAHTNFSTESMRKEGGMKAILAAIERLSKTHPEHISQYGTGAPPGSHLLCAPHTLPVHLLQQSRATAIV